MIDIREVIDSLKREIDAGRREIEAKEIALRMLQERYGATQALPGLKVQAPTQAAPLGDGDLFDLASLVTEDSSRKRTFVDDLRDVLRRFGAQEFNITHAEAALKKLGIEVAGKTPRSRISASLSKLNDEGFIVKTFEGGGNVPNRYKIRSSLTEGEAARLEAAGKPHERVVSGDQPDVALGATGAEEEESLA